MSFTGSENHEKLLRQFILIKSTDSQENILVLKSVKNSHVQRVS